MWQLSFHCCKLCEKGFLPSEFALFQPLPSKVLGRHRVLTVSQSFVDDPLSLFQLAVSARGQPLSLSVSGTRVS